MTDWQTCPAVERHPDKFSGAWVFRGTRVPIATLFENLKDGASIEQFLEWFPGVEGSAMEAVLEHEVQALTPDVPVLHVGTWPAQLSLRREDLYGDDGYPNV